MSTLHPAHGDEPVSGLPLPALYNLVYCSQAAPGTDASSVERIIETAQRRNPIDGITGLLVFGGGIFFQWLEGPRDNLTALMAKLRADPRHEALVVLSEGEEVRERLFPDWDMELVTTTDIREVLVDAKSNAKDAQNAAAVTRLLERLDSGELRGLGAF